MHSPSALTEHVSRNLAGFFLLDPVYCQLGRHSFLLSPKVACRGRGRAGGVGGERGVLKDIPPCLPDDDQYDEHQHQTISTIDR